MAGTTNVALPVSVNWNTALATALRRSGERQYHQRALVSVTNRVRLTIDPSRRPLGQVRAGFPDGLDVLEAPVLGVGHAGQGTPQRGQ